MVSRRGLVCRGLSRQDTRIRFVLPVDASAAFNSGQINAWAVFDPYLAVAQQNGGRLITDASHLTTSFSFLTATTASLADPAKRQAIQDFAGRVRKARLWAVSHPQQYAASYAALSQLPLSTARLIISRGSTDSRNVTPGDLSNLQSTADRFYHYGILPQKINVSEYAITAVPGTGFPVLAEKSLLSYYLTLILSNYTVSPKISAVLWRIRPVLFREKPCRYPSVSGLPAT